MSTMKRIAPIRLRSGHEIGFGGPCFVVAEIGNNHQGDLKTARKMIVAAAAAGVQAVKFQKRDTDSLLTRAGRETPYTGKNSFGPTYGEHRNALELDIEEMAELKEFAESLGLVFFASAWDRPSLKQMIDLDVELIKVCSADLVNVPMLRQAAETGLPLIISTGMSSFDDIDLAVAEVRQYHSDIVLLHCNSSYPCTEEKIGLPVMRELGLRYNLPVGYSGHERGLGPSVAAVALGACCVERHFTLDKNMPGTDHPASLEPHQLADMVRMIREVERAMQVKAKTVYPEEAAAASKLRKSIVFSRDLPAGHVLGPADLCLKCPGTGLSPVHWDQVLGATLTRSVRHEDMLALDMVTLAQPALRKGVLS